MKWWLEKPTVEPSSWTGNEAMVMGSARESPQV
jgi:hypothetical protein